MKLSRILLNLVVGFSLLVPLSLAAEVWRNAAGQLLVNAEGLAGGAGSDGWNNYGQALSGMNGFEGQRGGDGSNGRAGGNAGAAMSGSAGGQIHLWFSPDSATANAILVHGHAISGAGARQEIPSQSIPLQANGSVFLSVAGGAGGEGGNGGQGEGGGDGGRGGNASRWTSRSGDGGNGGNGGNAGRGSNGANGGTGGEIHLYGARAYSQYIVTNVAGGRGGDAGANGRAGRGGRGGDAGDNCFYDTGANPPSYQCVMRGMYGRSGMDGQPDYSPLRAGSPGGSGQVHWH